MEIKVIKDGVQSIQQIDGDLDFKSMGVLTRVEVDEAKARWQNEASKKSELSFNAKFDELNLKLDSANKAKDAITTGKSAGDDRIAQLTDTIETLSKSVADERNLRLKSQVDASVLESVSSRKIVEGGADIFKMRALSVRQEDGSYLLPTGLTGTIAEYSESFFNSPAGKALSLSSQVGGAGSDPKNATTTSKIADMSTAQKVAYAQEHGQDAYHAKRRSEKK